MAADENDDALEDACKLGLLPKLANSVHVYHSRNDLVLKLSDETKGNPDRLGSNGPRNVFQMDTKIQVIDCQHVDFTDPGDGNHQYYRLREEVIDDVRQVLRGTPASQIENREIVVAGRSYRIRRRKG